MNLISYKPFLALLFLLIFSSSFSQVQYKPGIYKSERDPRLGKLDYSGSSLILSSNKSFELEFHDMESSTTIKGKWYVKKDTLYLVNKNPGNKAKSKNIKTPGTILMVMRENYLCAVEYVYIRCMSNTKK